MQRIKFEVDCKANLSQLKEEIKNGDSLDRSIIFVVNKPVKRIIFDANFRDRAVQHWLINKLNSLFFEKVFIQDFFILDQSLSCFFQCVSI